MIGITVFQNPGTFGVEDHGSDREFMDAQTPGIVAGAEIQATEYRRDIDGSDMPRYELSEEYSALIVVQHRADEIAQELQRTATTYETFTITTPHDVYTTFRAVDFYEDNTEASMYRIHLQKDNPEKFWLQYYSEEFLIFLMDHFDTRGIKLIEEDISERVYL